MEHITIAQLPEELDQIEARIEVAIDEAQSTVDTLKSALARIRAIRGDRPVTVQYSMGVGYYTDRQFEEYQRTGR